MNRERAQEIVDELQGTAKSIEDCLTPEELNEFGAELPTVLTDAIDEQIFECSVCGWWCELGEAVEKDDGDCCEDCSDD